MKFTIANIFVLIFFIQYSWAKTVEVCPSCIWVSIKAAIEAAEAGDEIIVKSGIYKEGNILIKKSIHLRGENFPIIDGENKTEIITIHASDVTIEGFQIQNVGNSYIEDRAAIRVEKGHRYLIQNNKLINTFFGIYLAHANDGAVLNNTVVGEAKKEMSSGNAIHLWYCKRVKIEGNQVAKHRDGIYLEFVDHSIIQNNVSEKNLRYGLHFMFSNDDNYLHNTFRNNGAGVAVMFSRRINMFDNVFEHNWGKASYGLLLKEIYDAEILNNLFKENTIGIFVEGSNRVNYKNNNFQSNGWAMKISGGCMDNAIEENNFISNTFDLAMNSSKIENAIDGNYWSEYSGYDLDKDGVGDVPHRPIKLFNYVLKDTPEAMVLLRSVFVDLINFSEKVSPVFTPANIFDEHPAMKQITSKKITLNHQNKTMINIENLHKAYGKNEVLKGIDLAFEKPGITAVLGPNGSGKTTLIKCILGMVIPQKGDIRVGDENIKNQWIYRNKIDYLPQIARFPENLRVKELLAMIKDIRGGESNSQQFVELFNLEPFLDKRLGNLSGGTVQKVNIMLALMYDSPIIILDEPTSGLDPLSLIRLKNIILQEKAKGKIILITTHIMSFVEEMADDIVFLLEGNIYFHGNKKDMLQAQQASSVESAIAKILEDQQTPFSANGVSRKIKSQQPSL